MPDTTFIDPNEALPEDGWVTAGQQPATLCRWCLDGTPGWALDPRPEPVERHLVTMRGVVICSNCDMLERW